MHTGFQMHAKDAYCNMFQVKDFKHASRKGMANDVAFFVSSLYFSPF
jgi:hypothetical protein